MLLESELLLKYQDEIDHFEESQKYLDDSPGKIYFGLFAGEILKAFAALKCYVDEDGNEMWMLRGCYSKEDFRGGLQLELIEERINYLRSLSNSPKYVYVSVDPDNTYSRINIEKAGFKLETTVLLKNNQLVWRYKKKI